jgi:hypothetical protein
LSWSRGHATHFSSVGSENVLGDLHKNRDVFFPFALG